MVIVVIVVVVAAAVVFESFERARGSGRDASAGGKSLEIVQSVKVFVVEASRQMIRDDARSRVRRSVRYHRHSMNLRRTKKWIGVGFICIFASY